ncbi:hypothetical protein DFH06DRAFT_1179679 [Mycena polygramma]|nr:hypothetical protein DFH06DRAFT_1179679 [Mycena polygramma]
MVRRWVFPGCLCVLGLLPSVVGLALLACYCFLFLWGRFDRYTVLPWGFGFFGLGASNVALLVLALQPLLSAPPARWLSCVPFAPHFFAVYPADVCAYLVWQSFFPVHFLRNPHQALAESGLRTRHSYPGLLVGVGRSTLRQGIRVLCKFVPASPTRHAAQNATGCACLDNVTAINGMPYPPSINRHPHSLQENFIERECLHGIRGLCEFDSPRGREAALLLCIPSLFFPPVLDLARASDQRRQPSSTHRIVQLGTG